MAPDIPRGAGQLERHTDVGPQPNTRLRHRQNKVLSCLDLLEAKGQTKTTAHGDPVQMRGSGVDRRDRRINVVLEIQPVAGSLGIFQSQRPELTDVSPGAVTALSRA